MTTILTMSNWVDETLAGGRYRVVEKLGEGGMGHVYRARDENLLIDVVIKAPRVELLCDELVTDRFAAEIRSLVNLAHPHIVRIIDVGHHQSIPYAVMQYLSGGSLEDRVRNRNPQSTSRIATYPESLQDWLLDLAEALDFIHKMDCVHRDVKPANVLFDVHNNVYLGDFGVVKAAASISEQETQRGLTRPGMALGTPEYMAPELLKGDPYAGASDQYSLAATVYELLTGRLPYEGPTAAAILIKQMAEAPIPLSELRPDLSRSLSRAVLKGLAREPENRYPDCSIFAQTVLDQIRSPRGGSSGYYAAVAAAPPPSATTPQPAALIAARLIAPEPPYELARDVCGWTHRWGAQLIEADVDGAQLRFDIHGGWLQKLMRKEAYFLADLAFADLRGGQTQVDMTISCQGDKQPFAELSEQAYRIYRMIRESLALVSADSLRSPSQTTYSRSYLAHQSPNQSGLRPLKSRPPSGWIIRSGAGTDPDAGTPIDASAPADDRGPDNAFTIGVKLDKSPPNSFSAETAHQRMTNPSPASVPATDRFAQQASPRMSSGADASPSTPSLFPCVAMIRLYLNPESANQEMIVCPVIRVSPKAMTIISPRQLLPADVFIRLPNNDSPYLARIVHGAPRDDGRYQIGIVFADTPPNLMRLFGHVNS